MRKYIGRITAVLLVAGFLSTPAVVGATTCDEEYDAAAAYAWGQLSICIAALGYNVGCTMAYSARMAAAMTIYTACKAADAYCCE